MRRHNLRGDRLGGPIRFEQLLKGIGNALHDVPLIERDAWLLAPTLGAVIPGWYLAIPRKPFLNMREWAATGQGCVKQVVLEVLRHLNLKTEQLIWFEHGPALAGTSVGCGLDHAHMHILIDAPFSFDAFAERARALADLCWLVDRADQAYDGTDFTTSYLIAGSAERCIHASDVEEAGSQFFRRVVASLVGADDQWDYRSHAHEQNIELSVARFARPLTNAP